MTYPEDFLLKDMLRKEFSRDSVGWLPFHRGVDGEIVVRRLELFGLFQVRTGVGFCQQWREQPVLLPSVTNERVTVDESTTRSRHSDSIGQAFLWALLPMLVLFLIAPSVGNAQVPVVTNITSSGLGTEVQTAFRWGATTLPEGPDLE